jgi:hypothetical protein
LARLILGLVYGALEALPEEPASMAAALVETKTLVHAMLNGLNPRFSPAPA